MSIRCVGVAVALALAVLAGGAPASARIWTVGNGGEFPWCPPPDYSSIQDAIDAAAPYDTISVCPGGYRENLLFAGHRKSHISVIGDLSDLASVAGDGRRPTIEITAGARDVELSHLTVIDESSGPAIDIGGGPRGVRLSRLFVCCTAVGKGGVRVDRAARVAIDQVGFGGVMDAWCWGVDVGGRAYADVTGSYGSLGVRATGSGTRLRAVGNRLFGAPGAGTPPANGAVIRDGARATLQQNEFQWFLRPDPWADEAWKINSGVIRVENTARVVVGNLSAEPTGDGNVVRDSSSDGVVVRSATHVIVAGNAVSGLFGRGLVVSADSRHNRFFGNRLTGNLLFRTEAPAEQPWFGPEEDYDCRDASTGRGTAGTANAWTGNFSDAGQQAASPPGICAVP
jgi:hypothetical protein